MATANPQLSAQHQALRNLKRIHRLCLIFEAIQVLGSIVVLGLAYLPKQMSSAIPLQLYAAMFGFFTAVFAHVVVYNVLLVVGKNVRNISRMQPTRMQTSLVYATSRAQNKILPFVLAHIGLLMLVVSLATISSSEPRFKNYYHASTWVAAILSVLCLVRISYSFRSNTHHLTSFVTSDGFAKMEAQEV